VQCRANVAAEQIYLELELGSNVISVNLKSRHLSAGRKKLKALKNVFRLRRRSVVTSFV
jgi:hypothetical protein